MKAWHGAILFLVFITVIGGLMMASAPPTNRCTSLAAYNYAPRESVELYPNDIRVIHADGSVEYVPPLHAVQVLTNPITDYNAFVTTHSVEASNFPTTAIFYGTVKIIETQNIFLAFWYLDRNLVAYYQC